MPKGKNIDNESAKNGSKKSGIHELYENEDLFNDEFWNGNERMLYDRELFNDLTSYVSEHIKDEESRVEYLADLAYIHETQNLPEDQKAAIERFITKNMVPVENGMLNQAAFRVRMEFFREKLKASYRAVSRAAGSGDGEPDLSGKQKVEDFIRNVHQDATAQKIYKWTNLFDVISMKATEEERKALGREYKDYSQFDCQAFSEAEMMAGFLAQNPDGFNAMMAPLEESAAFVTYLLGALHKPLNDELRNASEAEKNTVRFAQENNPQNQKNTIISRCNPSPEDAALLGEHFEKARKELEDRTMSKLIYNGLNTAGKQKKLANLYRTLRDNDFIQALRTSYFNKADEFAEDRARTKLSFGRKGSTEFQSMEKSVDEVRRLLSRAISDQKADTPEKNAIVRALQDTVRKVQTYTKNKMGDLTLDQITNENSRKRILYAQKIGKEAENLLKAIEGIKKSATAAEGVEGLGTPGIKNKEGKNLSEKGGTFTKLLVPEEFKNAVEASGLRDKVCFEEWQDGKWTMHPKYPESGDGFSIRKNMNYLMKGLAGNYFRNPRNPEYTEFDIKKGNSALKTIGNCYRHCLETEDSNKRLLDLVTIAGMLNVPQEDKKDFEAFMEACIRSRVRIDHMVEKMREDAEIAGKMRKVYASRTATKKEKKFVNKRTEQHNNALAFLAGAAQIDPATYQKMILPNDSQNGADMMAALYDMARKEKEAYVEVHVIDYTKKEANLLEIEKEPEDKIPDFEKRDVLEAGSVSYKGKEYVITFEGLSETSAQLLHGIGMREAKIGIFENPEDIEALYLRGTHYNDVKAVKEKYDFISPDRKPKKAAYNLMYEADASENDYLMEEDGRKNVGRERTSFEKLLENSREEDSKNRNEYVRISVGSLGSESQDKEEKEPPKHLRK